MAGNFKSPRRLSSTERIVTGVNKLDRKLKKLERKAANRVARSGLWAGVRFTAKQIKQEIPAKLKSVRASIGGSVKKSKAGVTVAKVGAAVGKAGKKTPKRTTKHGKGISRRNIHWWIMGTDKRHQKKVFSIPRGSPYLRRPGPTGAMPDNPVVKKGFRPVAVRSKIIEAGKKALKRELAKLKGK